MFKLVQLFSLAAIVLLACNPKTAEKIVEEEKVEERQLDTMVVQESSETEEEVEEEYSLPIYNASATREVDLLHTRLDLSFNWEKQHVLGEAYIDLTPVFYPVDTIKLNAVSFDIHSVKMNDKNGEEINYIYADNMLKVIMPGTLERSEIIRIYIDYTAKPNEAETGGSAAISSDKGLYFINPTGDSLSKPRQIWTQGETESNRRWFPTVDKPNERMTHEMYLTVDDFYETLSNGALISSEKNGDGTRTDYWKMDKPHAPYLFMIAVGDYAVVKDSWNNIPVNYYVEHDYREDASAIFGHTPEMLTFFSELVDYTYPWPKYSQVVVRDFVSGAMENTTGVIFGDFVQKHKEELITSPNDDIVAHEMFHHWFGDLVTTENWANLVLNEGFANYSEYLWREHKYGVDHAESHRYNQLKGYLNQAASQRHSLVRYDYTNEMQMFDAHSYNKGGLVLHMIRNYIGDEAFFTSLNKYLVDNEYTAVEVDELRMAFEDVTGKDMHWFFNQWFHASGHPDLKVDHTYNAETNTITLEVIQRQDPENNEAIYQLPTQVEIFYGENDSEIKEIFIDEREQTFVLNTKEEPQLVLFDPQYVNLATIDDSHSNEEYINILKYSTNYRHKFKALEAATLMPKTEALNSALLEVLNDPYYKIRAKALSIMKYDNNTDRIKTVAMEDPKPQVRVAALKVMQEKQDSTALTIAMNRYENAEALYEKMNSLKVIHAFDQERGLELAEKNMDEDAMMASSTITSILAGSGDKKYIPYFHAKVKSSSGFANFSMLGSYSKLVQEQEVSDIENSVDFLVDLIKDESTDQFTVFSGAKTLSEIRSSINDNEDEKSAELITEINNAIKEVYENLSEGRLKNMVGSYVR